MGSCILIATPIRSFGELISQVLQEVGYYPLLVADVANALDAIRVEDVDLAVIDCKMPSPGTEFLIAALRDQLEDLPLLFLHPDDSCDHTVTLGANDRKLPQPFYLPDLLSTVGQMLPGEPSNPEDKKSIPPSEIPAELQWLKDIRQAAQYLTLLSLEADAQAALIVRASKIWAYAGELPQAGADELAHLLGQHMAESDTGDLARFVRLHSTGTELMFYATGLGAGFALMLAFETEMPFSKMRAQAGEIARKLISPSLELLATPVDPAQGKENGEISNTVENRNATAVGEPAADDWLPEKNLLAEDQEPDEIDEILARQTAMFEDLLASIDIPDPDGASSRGPQQNKKTQEYVLVDTDLALPESDEFSLPAFEFEPGPKPDQRSSAAIGAESETSTIHDLAYTCVLIPRLPEHLLSRDLGTLLNQSVSRLCLAYGWRLEHLAVRPQYLHWVVNVSPDVSPAKVIRTLREKTSEMIFEERPVLKKENPSGDFWAPGFLVIHGRSLTGDRLQEYLQRTRSHQGIDPAKNN